MLRHDLKVDRNPRNDKQWTVSDGRILLGMVEKATPQIGPEPEYIASYIPAPLKLAAGTVHPAMVTHGRVFWGEFANVEAVAFILRHARRDRLS